MRDELWRGIVETAAWLVAAGWGWKTSEALRFLPALPNLTSLNWDIAPKRLPTLTVVVPARDEAANIAATLDALLLADYAALKILVMDDRSTDGTGAIVDAYVATGKIKSQGLKPLSLLSAMRPETKASGYLEAVGHAPILEVIHIRELPEGWLGKTHAMALAMERSDSEYILFTDADVLFSPSILRRAMAYVEQSEADHLVVLPTMQLRAHGEGIVLGFFQVLGMWASRLWRVSDPESLRDFAGIGAFNLVRRQALEQIGGWAPQRMTVLEDVTLGRRMKNAGMRQRIAFAPGLVLVHWASGARGLVRVMTKNLFSAFNFRPLLLLGACVWIAVFCVAPAVGLFWWPTLLPGLIVVLSIGVSYRLMGEFSGIDARYAWLYPLGAGAFLEAMLRSMVMVLWRRGVVWRGTFYPLRELRLYNSPMQWRKRAER